MEIIVGTAGHIDHGKTALVRALTGTDADRLPEEKQRGITIDIGFAELETGDVHFGFVDVPGHERFVKNMLAGASGIDMVLLVIAADEGVMPQTREHFEICRLLGLERGIVVLTKSDLVDRETLELAQMEAAEMVKGPFLEDAPVVTVSSHSGKGIEELKTELSRTARSVSARNSERTVFMPIDRSFTVKGFGAVVTGTLASGEITEGAELELLPAGKKVRVRGVQTHKRAVRKADPGQRTAVNLGSIEHTEITRGMALAEPYVLRPTQIFNADVEILAEAAKPLGSRQRVRIHIGTAEVLARVFVMNEQGEIAPGEKDFVQFRLEAPVACLMGDRFIVRSYSPQQTIGGGRIILPLAEKHRKKDLANAVRLTSALASAEGGMETVCLLAEAAGEKGISFRELQAMTGWKTDILKKAVKQNLDRGLVTAAGGLLIDSAVLETLYTRSLAAISAFHRREPLAAGMPREALREKVFRYLSDDIFSAALSRLISEDRVEAEKDLLRLKGHRTEISPAEKAVMEKLRTIFREAALVPPKLADAIAAASGDVPAAQTRKLFEMLVRSGELVKVTDDYYFSTEAIKKLKTDIRMAADDLPDRTIDVPGFKEIAGVSRKYAIPLLEYFDRERVTTRAGDKRIVMK